jgi:hypothetical protein
MESTVFRRSIVIESTLRKQVGDIIVAHPGNQKMKYDLHAAWEMLESFLDQHGALPEQLHDIEATQLAAFVKHCRECGMSEVSLPTVLGALRMLLKDSGHTAATLSALTAPVHRERISNDVSGKRRHQLRFRDEARDLPNETIFACDAHKPSDTE